MTFSEMITDMFHREELFQVLQELIQRRSENPPGNEEGIATYIKHLLEENGLQAELQWAGPQRPNVLVRIKGHSPGAKVIYNGHLDVVPAGAGWSVAPFDGMIKDGKLYGRGAADMKSGVAAMLYAAIVLNRMGNPFAGEIILFFDVDEERLNLGMKHFLTRDIQADYAIIGEPTELNVCIGHLGCARYKLKTFGTPGHTSVVVNPDNAIYKMVALIQALQTLSRDIHQRVDPILGRASLTVSRINGGTAVNIVPDHCKIEIDRRIFPNDTYETVIREIEGCVRDAADPSKISYDLECYQFVPATVIDKMHPLVQQLVSVSGRIRKQEISVKAFSATCEAPFLSIDKGIPTVIFGPGSLAQAHVIDEHIALEEVEQASLILVHLGLDLPRK